MRRSLTQARWEFGLLMRNGEQLLLLIVIPVILLIAMRVGPNVLRDALQPDQVIATVASVSVMAGCFTSLAIATGFERRSGALRYLATTPLRRWELIAGKVLAALAVTAVSVIIVVGVGLGLGWRGLPSSVPELALHGATLVVGCLAWAMLALLIAGALRAEAVLAVANGIFVLALAVGGIIIPAAQMGRFGAIVELLPSGALADGLRGATLLNIVILVCWAALGAVVAAFTFRWEDR